MDLQLSQPKGRERMNSVESANVHGANGQLKLEIPTKEFVFGLGHSTLLKRLQEPMTPKLGGFVEKKPRSTSPEQQAQVPKRSSQNLLL